MTRDDIKAAAANIADIERIEALLADIARGAGFTLVCGQTTIPIAGERTRGIEAAVMAYLKSGVKDLHKKVDGLGLEDEFDAAIAKLEQEALPQ